MSEVEEESDGWFRLRTITTEWNSEEEEEEKKARGETNVRIKVRGSCRSAMSPLMSCLKIIWCRLVSHDLFYYEVDALTSDIMSLPYEALYIV